MGFRVNYNQQRADRNRVKEQKKLERLARREGDPTKSVGEGEEGEAVDPDAPEHDLPDPVLVPDTGPHEPTA